MCVLPPCKTGEEFEGYSTTFWEPIKSWYSFDPIVVSTMTLACFEAVKNFGSGQTCVLRNWYVLLAFNCELDVRITQDLDLSRGLFCICRAAKQTSFCFAKFCFLFLQFAHFSISDTVCCEQCVYTLFTAHGITNWKVRKLQKQKTEFGETETCLFRGPANTEETPWQV